MNTYRPKDRAPLGDRRYAANRAPSQRIDRGPSYDPDAPVAGFYRIRQRRGAPPSAIRIWLGPSIDPATGAEVEERGDRWQCSLNGERVPLEQHWPGCARDPIDQAEHDRILEASRTMDPDDHFYDPKKSIDLLRAPVPTW